MTTKGNLKSEQLLKDGSLILDYDEPIRGINKILILLNKYLLIGKVISYNLDGHNVYFYDKGGQNETLLLVAAVTYMGGSGKKTKHPEFLKRIQIPAWWNKIANKYQSKYNIKYFGIYNYKNMNIFCDVQKDTYMERNVNNSSAHIYMNDLVQAQSKGVFERKDQNGNIIISIDSSKIESYFRKQLVDRKEEFNFLKEFNETFINGETIIAKDAINEMRLGNSRHWKETEWPGWFLEYKFQQFLKDSMYSVVFLEDKNISNTNIDQTKLDFDLWLSESSHYADLKSSSIQVTEFIGNDKESVLQAIKKYGKLWYIVYQHHTKLDRDVVGNWEKNFEKSQARQRALIINEHCLNQRKITKEKSYFTRMKHSVKYSGMFVLELNAQNIKHYALNFKQGRQPDGSSRNVKVKFNKRQIENGIVFSCDLPT